MGSKSELIEVAKFFSDGRLKAVVDRTFPLVSAADAHRALKSRAQFGKIVLQP
jgi:NADPH:quinone reductase-like Zn-dependent oxidoreductase